MTQEIKEINDLISFAANNDLLHKSVEDTITWFDDRFNVPEEVREHMHRLIRERPSKKGAYYIMSGGQIMSARFESYQQALEYARDGGFKGFIIQLMTQI